MAVSMNSPVMKNGLKFSIAIARSNSKPWPLAQRPFRFVRLFQLLSQCTTHPKDGFQRRSIRYVLTFILTGNYVLPMMRQLNLTFVPFLRKFSVKTHELTQSSAKRMVTFQLPRIQRWRSQLTNL